MVRIFSAVILLLAPFVVRAASADDERRIASPDGSIEYRIFIAQPERGDLDRLGYAISYHGRPAVGTSYLGIVLAATAPLLGESDGLLSEKRGTDERGRFNFLTLNYLQNGSLGKKVTMEIRVSNSGVAFRYLIPFTITDAELLVEGENTEFYLPGFTVPAPADKSRDLMPVPLVAEQPGVGWIRIAEVPVPDYPRITLEREYLPDVKTGAVLVTRLDRDYDGKTPYTCPWRVIVLGVDRESVTRDGIVEELTR